MNLASWIILAIVIALLAFAVKATFFKRKSKGGCCDVGDKDALKQGASRPESCGGCTECSSCATQRNALKPRIIEQSGPSK